MQEPAKRGAYDTTGVKTWGAYDTIGVKTGVGKPQQLRVTKERSED
jgi:hypothetical protein